MRNRPLCSVCLMVFLIFSIGMTAGGSRFFRELVPPEMKKQAGKEVQITGQVYQIEVRESYQILYLILSKKTSRILVYDDAKQPVQIGNKVNVKGELSLFEEARNPGNFDQKFYYEKQGLHASIWVKHCRITDQETWKFREWLAKLRRNWKRLLVSQMGARHGNSMSAILLGEKSELDAQMKALYQKSGIGHILAISGLHMSFIGMGFYGLLRRVGCPVKPAGVLGILFLLGYTVMIGGGVSAIRAFVMFGIRVGADLCGRAYDMATSLAVAAALIALESPMYLRDAGYLLSFGAVLGMAAGQQMSLGEMSLTCMAPSQEYQGETGNAASMVLWMEWKNLEMLLTGDVEGEGEVQLTEWMRAHGKTKCDILKAAHHGSKNSTLPEFLQQLTPKYAWISSGIGNRYGHPAKETVERLSEKGCELYGTQEYGAVTLKIKGEKAVIETFCKK